MILNGTQNPVETSGDIQSRSFKILASRKAFEILSSGLYSHKIKAIVRELGTNAADAHTAAGNPAPFTVTLPGRFHAYFEVKDFGTGLSESDVLNLYTTYFDSNKTTSNAFTGCLGLGSKSPFSYTDSFTVESRFGGEKTTYTAYLDTDGIPAVSKVAAEPTDEPNGLTVRIPVQADDFHEFHNECQAVYQWFKVRPVIEGQFAGFEEYDTLFDGTGYSIGRRKKEGHRHYRPFERGVLVMGNVAYPLEFHKAEGLGEWKDYGLVLYADIGSVEIAASREALSYDERTVAYLKARGEELKQDLPGHVSSHVGEADTLWEARTRLYKLKGLLKDLGIHAATWRDQEITPEVKIERIEVPGPAGSVERPYEATVYLYERYHGRWSNRRNGRPVKVNLRDVTSIEPTKPIWLADIKTWRQALPAAVGIDQVVYVIEEVRSPDFLARTGLDTAAKKISEIPKEEIERVRPPKLPRVPRVPLYKFVTEGGDAGLTENAKNWLKITDAPRNAIYVLIERFGPIGSNNTRLGKLIAGLRGLTGKTVEVIGIRVSDKDKIGKGWKTLDQYTKEAVNNAYNGLKDTVENSRYCAGSQTGILDYFVSSRSGTTEILRSLPKRHKLRRAVEALLAGKKLPKRVSRVYDAITQVVNYCPVELPVGKSRAKEAAETLFATYPLLEVVSFYRYSDKAEERIRQVIEYIKLVDATNR